MRIPVVFATDENYIFYTCVAITSLARTMLPDTVYDIYILTGEEISSQTFLDKLSVQHKNIHIQILKVDTDIFQQAVIHNNHVTKAAFYRLILSDILEVDKCIYLDSDVLVTEDLASLYMTDVKGYYVAGCRDIWIDLLSEKAKEERRQQAGIPSLDEYINSGVLIMNLKEIREDSLNKVFVQHIGRDYQYEDQDIINVCCYGRIKHLAAKWNIFTLFLGQLELLRACRVSEFTIKELQEKKGILHYATPFIRPWEHSLYWANMEWWETAHEWKGEVKYQRLYTKVHESEQQSRWSYWLEKCAKYERIIIFGFTVYGREVCDWLLNSGMRGKLAFCDNDIAKQQQMYKRILVLPLKSMEKKGTLFINVSRSRNTEVKQELLEYGVCEEDILCYVGGKKPEYYRYLDSRFYLDELKDIFLREQGRLPEDFQEDCDSIKRLLLMDLEYQPWHEKYHMREWILKG